MDCAVTSSGRDVGDGTPTVSFGTSSSTRGNDGEEEEEWTFWISSIGTTRSRKRPAVALTPETPGEGRGGADVSARRARGDSRTRGARVRR